MMDYIGVWFEYDFGGQFGGNNEQEVFEVDDNLTTDEIDKLVVDKLLGVCNDLTEDDIEGLWGWDYITMERLGE